jgi:hypothetical protein
MGHEVALTGHVLYTNNKIILITKGCSKMLLEVEYYDVGRKLYIPHRPPCVDFVKKDKRRIKLVGENVELVHLNVSR